MSKILKDAALIVGVVALAATGIGAAASAGLIGTAATATAGASFAGVSAATFSAVGLAASVASAGLTAISALTAKKPANVGNPMAWSADPQAGIPYIIGRTYAGGQIVYRRTYQKDDKAERIHTVYSAGPITSFDTFYVDGIATAISGDTAEINDRGKMLVGTQRGQQPERVQFGGMDAPDITAASKLSGLAASSITLFYDAKGGTTFTTEPQCGWVVHGVTVYDPRLDSTYPGGNGPQRVGDETTWTYSANPYLHALTWLIGRRQNGKLMMGVGVPVTGILIDQYVEGANVADANKWTISGTLSSVDDKWSRLKDMLQAGGGEPIRLGAQIGCIINTPRVSLATITVDDVVGDASVQATQAKRDRINAIVPRYTAEQSVTTEKSDGSGLQTAVTWAVTAGSPVIVADYVAFDGKTRQKEVDYTFVADLTQSQQLARYDIENAREFGPITLPMKLRWMGYKPGDVVTAVLPELGLNGQDILLLQRELSPADGTVTMTARSETAAKHAFALGQTGTAPATPSVTGPALVSTPDPSAWTLIGATVASPNGTAVPALIVTGAADSDAVDAILFQYRTSATDAVAAGAWIDVGAQAPSIEVLNITGVQDGTAYDVSISYRRNGNVGTPLILGPAVAGQTAIPYQSGVVGPKPPIDADNTATVWVGAAGQTIADTVASLAQVSSDIASLKSEVASAIDPDLTQLDNEIAQAQSDASSALSQVSDVGTKVTNLTSTVGDNSSGLVQIVASQTTNIQSLSGQITDLTTSFYNNSSSVSQSLVSLTNAQQSLSSSISALNSNFGGLSSSLSSEASTRANAISAVNARIDSQIASVTINPNLQKNGGFADANLSDSPVQPYGSQVLDVSGWGRVYEHGSTGNAALWMPSINVFAGNNYTVSWDFLLFASQGAARVDIVCYTGPNGTGNLTYGPSSQSYGGKDFSDGPRDAWTVTIPNGTQSIRVRLVTENVAGLTGVGWRRIKVENGSTASAFTDEGSANYVYANISNESATRASDDSAIANNVSSLTSRMGNAESNISSFSTTLANANQSIASLQYSVSAYTPVIANFLYNPTFAQGSQNWNYDSGWGFDTTYLEAKYYNGLNNQGAGMGQNAHFFVASQGAYYSLSMEAWTPGLHGGRLVMDIVWLDNGGNVITYSNRLTITQNNGGTWTRYSQDGQSGGIQAPQGAISGAARCFLEGATVDANGSIAVRRLQVERAPTAHAWVDYTDSSALQAQVSQNSAAINDIQTRQLGAFWQVVATAGNQMASISAVAQSGGTTYSAIELVAAQVSVKTSGAKTPVLAISGDTVTIAGNLVTTGSLIDNAVSSSATASMGSNVLSGNGMGSFMPAIGPYTLTLATNANVQLLLAGQNGYSQGVREYGLRLLVDGQVIASDGDAGGYQSNPVIAKTLLGLPAGSHTIEVDWAGADGTIQFKNAEIAMQVLKK